MANNIAIIISLLLMLPSLILIPIMLPGEARELDGD